jgi:uncharacterized protein (DUF305 family)
VIDPAALQEKPPPPGNEVTPATVWRWLPAFLALVVLASAAVLWLTTERPPDDNSLEAGFARDMMTHHEQAVAMALLARDRTDDPVIRSIATDMILTQQNQIGQMLGWLNLWGLPATGPNPPMAWMGHPTTGLMPGMATQEEIANLESLSGEEADIEFLRLIIRHHQAAIPMAEAALNGSDNRAVRDLARQILTAQEIEIATMESMLAAKGEVGG